MIAAIMHQQRVDLFEILSCTRFGRIIRVCFRIFNADAVQVAVATLEQRLGEFEELAHEQEQR